MMVKFLPSSAPTVLGKSTLLKLIVGLEAPTRGTIRFAGENITHRPPYRIRQMGVAMVQTESPPLCLDDCA